MCLQAASHGLDAGGRLADGALFRLLLDCAQVCQMTADFMLRGSEAYASVCRLCAEICERTAERCDASADDDVMSLCADACRECAGSCRTTAEAMAGVPTTAER